MLDINKFDNESRKQLFLFTSKTDIKLNKQKNNIKNEWKREKEKQ